MEPWGQDAAARIARHAERELEIRPVFEADDFGAEFTPELREQEERLRGRVADR